MKKKDVEAEEWKRQKQFFYEKFWTFGLGLSMLVVAGSYYWMRGWIHKYHHHPLHTFLNKKMNYLTLEKKSKNTYFQLCIVIFEEEQKNFFNTTLLLLSRIEQLVSFPIQKPISQHHTIMKWLYYYNCATSNYYNYYLWMNGKSIVNKHSFIALRDVFKINFDLKVRVLKRPFWSDFITLNIEYHKCCKSQYFGNQLANFNEVNHEHCTLSKNVHSGISVLFTRALLEEVFWSYAKSNLWKFATLSQPPLEVKKATLASL